MKLYPSSTLIEFIQYLSQHTGYIVAVVSKLRVTCACFILIGPINMCGYTAISFKTIFSSHINHHYPSKGDTFQSNHNDCLSSLKVKICFIILK